MATPLPDKSSARQIQERFDKDVERFSDLHTGQKATIDAPLSMELIAGAAAAVCPHARRVLDIGCGAGNNTLKLLQLINPLDCDLIDLSKPMLDRASQRVAAVNSGRIRAFQEDIRTVELPKEHYDIILAAAVLHHLRQDSDWQNVFAKIFALTAPGGCVWITDLVWHEHPAVQNMMWQRYGAHLEKTGGVSYREQVFEYVDREDSPRPLTYQVELLRKVGFAQVDILHKNAAFAAFGAVKSK